MTPRRVTVVASELLGRAGTGGAGTADSLLAVALGRHGHAVELIVASGREIGRLNPEWTRIYEAAGVEVRILDRLPGVRPAYLAPTVEVFHALRERAPDVVVANDWRGLGYAAMRARQVGVALAETAFVVHCHGPGRVLAEFAQKVPDTLERFGEEITERASIELADAVVSPSRWLLEWMREHGWPLPEPASVIPYPRRSAVLGESPAQAPAGQRVRRLAFFGQLREGKGIRIFLSALETVDASLLEDVEVIFLGSESKRWPPDGIVSGLRGARVETGLTREAALEELLQPGTLAVMPSLLDNSPNTVSECVEHGIPFVSTETGGIPELVAQEDRARVLCRPTSDALAATLTRALASPSGFAAARPAGDAQASVAAWLDLIESASPPRPKRGRRPTHVAIVASGAESERRAQRLAEQTQSVEVEVVRAQSRRAGLRRTAADWLVFLDDDDAPDDAFLDTLVRAQTASSADVVTAAVRPAGDPSGIQLFLGDPHSLGLIENQYGVVGLLRTELIAAEPLSDGGVDPDWPLFVRLALAGARLVSIPQPLSTHTGRIGHAADVPGEGLAVLEAFEARRAELPDLPQLAATLAAAYARQHDTPTPGPQPAVNGPVDRAFRMLLRRARARGGRA